ncbi:hypothetical protein KP509_27G012600 [Ceratopteris richardii]|uniref:Uncharacterized protein n=1 Tax=Ceratopteris richardii TaxID=49495 RepID=A0A8T2RDY8_CERRI|nr:hypothetical protein KP509_27G012600 [Ceratopteris richardii]
MDLSECAQTVDECRDMAYATHLKLGAIAAILAACVLGVCTPLVGRYVPAFHAESNLVFIMKSFAAGVILATAYVHMLPDSFEALSSPCLAEIPWAKFPFAGFISMLATLLVLAIDFSATTFYQNRHVRSSVRSVTGEHNIDADGSVKREKQLTEISVCTPGAFGSCDSHADAHVVPHDHDGHSHSIMLVEDEGSKLRQGVIAQVLELGIVAHSVIIGITLGTSESPCTIRPLLVALTFHQFFEGMALGSCIAQAGYRKGASTLMGFFFSVTTPVGIAIGMGIAATYNENSPKALIVQGLFDSISTGILLYMALVDLIATDFLSKRLRESPSLQVFTFTALFLGAMLMSMIAYWA